MAYINNSATSPLRKWDEVRRNERIWDRNTKNLPHRKTQRTG